MYRLIFILVTVTLVTAQYETYDFEQETVDELGGNITLLCDYRGEFVNETTTLWILPDLRNFNESSSDDDIYVSGDKKEITIVDIAQSDLGTYLCVMQTGEMLRVGLNLKGPYFEDLGEKYQQNVVYAFAAMLSFLAAALYVWLVVKFRYKPEDSTRIDPQQFLTASQNFGSSKSLAKDEKPHIDPEHGVSPAGSALRARTNGDVVHSPAPPNVDGTENAAYSADTEQGHGETRM